MPPEEVTSEKVLSAERSVARIRLAGLGFVTLVYAFLVDPSVGVPALAVASLAVAWVYALGVLAFEPYRRFPLLRSGFVAMLADAAFIAVWVVATGGVASPFFLLYYAAVVSIAFRYGDRETLVASLLYAGSYVAVVGAFGELWESVAEVVVRVGFLFVVATFASMLTREALDQARARLEMSERFVQAQTAEARFRGLVEAAPDAMVIAEDGGRIVLVNSEAERLFGYSREDLLGKPIDLLVPARPHLFQVGLGEASTEEVLARRHDGTTLPVEVRVSPVETEAGRLYTSTIRDLTERKKSEEERLTNVERLKELERLRELDKFKTTFINTAAHELGTPLTPIKLQLHLLRTSRQGDLSEQQRRSLEILERNVNRLHDLVKDVLDVARLQASRLGITRQPIDLNRVVLESAESFQEPARQAGVQLEVRLTPNLVMEADANRLTQVLFNLLSNSLKFTPRGGSITLETTRMNDQALVRVRDNGVGLRSEDIRRLFQPFSQVHDPMQKTRAGSGLGLYISKGIVELHGGRIWAESPGAGLGATFSFSLPFKAAPLPAAPPGALAEPQPTPEDTVARRARELI